MFSIPGTVRVFVYSLPTDMRRQMDGLSALVTHTLQQDLSTGDYFVFFNRSRTFCKILRWEPSGYELFAKRLERGTFRRPTFDGQSLSEPIDGLDLAMILGGVDPVATKRRKRYEHRVATNAQSRETQSSSRVADHELQPTG
jgi:transposase